jgi:Zn-dependent protease/CBS domain-containing protein
MSERESTTTIRPLLRRGVSLFHLAGIDVRLDYTWFLIFALILVSLSAGYFPRSLPGQSLVGYWVAGTLASLLLFVSILLHEFSHALVARRSGIRVPAITLFLFGGVSHLEDEARTPATELRVAAVGPVTSFALAGLCFGLERVLPPSVPPLVAGVVSYLTWINAALGVFNLLPGFPLDGGRVLRAVAWWRTGSLRRATRLAANAGKGLAIGLVVLGGLEVFSGALVGGLWLVFIGLFLRSIAEAGYENLVLTQTLADARVEDVAVRDVVVVSPQITIQTLVDDYVLPRGYRSFPVVEGDRPVGLISLDEVREVPAERRASTTVKERMRPLDDALRVSPDRPLRDALKQLSAAPGGRMLVMQGDELVGLLTRGALARFIEIHRLLHPA